MKQILGEEQLEKKNTTRAKSACSVDFASLSALGTRYLDLLTLTVYRTMRYFCFANRAAAVSSLPTPSLSTHDDDIDSAE